MNKILIIEKQGHTTNRVEAILLAPDFKLFTACNNDDGYKIARRYIPDLILFICSSVGDEYAFLRKISSDETIAAIPLIIITDELSFEKQRRVMDLGADDYIPAVFLESSLINSVNQRLLKFSLIKQNIQNSLNTFDENMKWSEENDHILVKIGNKLKFVEFSEIVCITALKEYSKIVTSENCKIIVRKSLKSWLKLLPVKSFLRIHRATIININYIEEISRINERTYTVHMKNINESFDFSYRYANLMRRTFPT